MIQNPSLDRRDGVLRSAALVGTGTLLSRLLGFLREILMAAVFGTSTAQSAFVVAFRIPNLFRRLFGEGALSSALVPVFAESLEHDGRERAWLFAGRVLSLAGLWLVGIVLAGEIAVSLVLRFAPLPDRVELSLVLLRVMLPYMPCICLVAVSMAILNTFRHFLVPAITPALLNVLWIMALVAVSPRFGTEPGDRVFGVAWGILAAGLVQLAVQVPVLVRYGFRFRLPGGWRRDPRVAQVLLLMGPAAVGMGITQINVFVDTVLALWIGKWAPAALAFAERLVYLPLGATATALGTVLLPAFSRHVSRAQPEEIRRTLNQSLRALGFVMLPAAAGLFVLADPIVRLVYQRGAFDERSAVLTVRALRFYAPGLLVFSLYKVFVPAFYAMKDPRTPVRVGIRMVGLNFLLNLTFMLTWPLEYKHAGLAFATVLSGAANSVTLGWLLHRRLGSPGWPRICRQGLLALAATAGMSVAAGISAQWLARHLAGGAMGDTLQRLIVVAGSMAAGVTVYLVLAALLCWNELADLRRAFGRRRPE